MVALPDLATDDAIHVFIYGLKAQLKGYFNVQVSTITDASLNKVMTAVLKFKENI